MLFNYFLVFYVSLLRVAEDTKGAQEAGTLVGGRTSGRGGVRGSGDQGNASGGGGPGYPRDCGTQSLACLRACLRACVC